MKKMENISFFISYRVNSDLHETLILSIAFFDKYITAGRA